MADTRSTLLGAPACEKAAAQLPQAAKWLLALVLADAGLTVAAGVFHGPLYLTLTALLTTLGFCGALVALIQRGSRVARAGLSVYYAVCLVLGLVPLVCQRAVPDPVVALQVLLAGAIAVVCWHPTLRAWTRAASGRRWGRGRAACMTDTEAVILGLSWVLVSAVVVPPQFRASSLEAQIAVAVLLGPVFVAGVGVLMTQAFWAWRRRVAEPPAPNTARSAPAGLPASAGLGAASTPRAVRRPKRKLQRAHH